MIRDNDITTFQAKSAVIHTRRRTKLAPDKVFDYGDEERCMGICMGNCRKGRGCPFLGCSAKASHLEMHYFH